MSGRQAAAETLADDLERGLDAIRARAARLPRRPRVFFEEWDDPLISGICWVDELIEIAGGDPLFPDLRRASLAKDRIVTADVGPRRRIPEVIIASWCGKAMKKRTIVERPGWSAISAVRNDQIYEIKSTYILQPGPASLTEGVARLHDCIARAARLNSQFPASDAELRLCTTGVATANANCEPRTRSYLLIKFRNSDRVRASLRNAPSIALVTATEFCFSTPRMDMHRCVASVTTATPSGLIFSVSVSAI